MDPINHVYCGKVWKVSSTVADNNSFFHAAFGVRVNWDEPYLDKRVKFRRMRWATFLSYFEDETMPTSLADMLKKCLRANDKYKHSSVEDESQFNDYMSDIMKAEHDVTIEEIPILATLENVKVILFKGGELEPAIIINPNNEILGNYSNSEKNKGEAVLRLEGNVFSRMNPVVENPEPKFTKLAEVTSTKNSVEQTGSGLMKYKKGGSAGSEGVQFQVGLLTVFFLNALRKLTDWKLSTENTSAGKFDDVVLEWPEGTTLLQAKHKQSKTKKITLEELVSTNSKNDDFSIPKYFLSYEEIKKTFKLKKVIICTNASVEGKVMKFLKAQNVKPGSMLHYENCDCKFYTFSDEILPHLKENVISYYKKNFQNKSVHESAITDENIKEFLGYFQLFINYPPGNDIGKVIEQLLSHMKLLQNVYVEVSPLDIYTKLLDWFQQKDGVYITELYAKAIFSEIWRDKHWQRLEKYKIFFQCNNLNFQTSKKLFHLTIEGGCLLLQEIKVFRTLHSNKTKFLFVNAYKDTEKQKWVMEAFGLPQYTILVLLWPRVTEEHVRKEASCKLREILDRFGYKKVVLITDRKNKIPELVGLSNDNYDIINESVTLGDLSKDSQERILEKENIIFQERHINLKELLAAQATESYVKFLNAEELEKLVKDEKVKVGASVLELEEHIMQFYIKRKLKREIKYDKKEKTKSSTREEIFSEEMICEMRDKVVLISDSAGTGKSTVLTNLAVAIKKKYPHLWVIRIDLNDYTQILKDFLGKNRETINILELLNSKHSSKFTNHLELSVFSMKEKVVLMLDGFDEISPDYAQLVLSLLSHSREQRNFAKIVVTTRPHMARELDEILRVEPLILEPFAEQNQVDFLADYWMLNLKLKDTERGKCEKYATALIKKMSSWVRSVEPGTHHFTAIPLHVRMLGEIFQEYKQFEMPKDWEGCKEYLVGNGMEPKLPDNMSVTVLYKMFIEKKRSVFIDKGNPSGNTAANQALIEQFEECLAYHKSIALELILDKAQCELFSCCQQTATNVEMNVLKIGIVQKVDNEFHFAHRTFAEYFIAKSLIEELQRPNENEEFQKFIIEEILLKPQFNVVCIFFNSFLQQIVHDLSFKTFYKYQCSRYKITSPDVNKFNLLHRLAENGHVAILQLILKCIDSNFTTALPEGSIQFFKTPSGQKFPKFSNVLEIAHIRVRLEGLDLQGILIEKTLLELAGSGGHLAMVKFLLELGANVDIGKFKPVHVAASQGHFQVLKCLAEHGADITAKDSYHGTTVLFKAVERNDIAMTTYLLDRTLRNSDFEVTDFIIPYTAAYLGRLDILKKFMEQGSVVCGRTETGETAVFGAARGGQLEIVRFLAQQGCSINSRDDWDNTALHVISRDPSLLSTAKLLMELGIDVNAQDFKSSAALHIAIEESNFDLVQLLVSHGADVNLTEQNSMTALHIATEKKNFKAVELLVNCGADVSLGDVEGNTALHVAAKNLCGDIIKFLVRHGININSENKYGCTALYYFIIQHSVYFRNISTQCVGYSQNLDVFKFLIKNAGDVNIRHNGSTLLHLAVEMDQLDIASLLVEYQVDTDITDNDGRTALHLAALEGYTHIVEYLVRNKADSNIRDNEGRTVLHYLMHSKDQLDFIKSALGRHVNSTGKDNYDILRVIIENGGDVNLKTNDSSTLLHLAARWGNLDVVVLLVEFGVDVNVRDIKGATALHLAVGQGHLNVVEYLVKVGADVTARDNSGYTVLHLAVNTRKLDDVLDISDCANVEVRNIVDGAKQYFVDWEEVYLDIVKAIIAVHSEIIDIKDDIMGCTALHLASIKGHLEIVKLLIEHGSDVNSRDADGRTPLHMAVLEGRLNVVTLLVMEHNVNVNSTDNGGFTALHNAAYKVDVGIIDNDGQSPLDLAILNDRLEVIEFFMTQKSNIVMNDCCHTALHLAVKNGRLDIVKLLLNYNVDLNYRDVDGCTALHVAAREGQLEIAKFLLDEGADVGIADKDDHTPLHMAAEIDKLDIVVALVEFGVDVDARDKTGSTALHKAVNKGNFDTVEYLVEAGIDIRIRNNCGHTALHLAAKGRDSDIWSVLWDIDDIESIGFEDNLLDVVRDPGINEEGRSSNKSSTDTELDLNAKFPDHFSDVWELSSSDEPPGIHLSIVKTLLAKGNEAVDIKDESGRTALHLAVLEGHLKVVEVLVTHNADVNNKDNNGISAFQLAVAEGRLDIAQLLVECGANINDHDRNIDWMVSGNNHRSILHLAAERGDLYTVVFFTELAVNVIHDEGHTALQLAHDGGHLKFVKYDLDFFKRRYVNVMDKDGNTALHFAVDKNSIDVVEFLVDFGIDLNIKNNDGRTALHLASHRGRLDIACFLVERGADLNVADNRGCTALHLAACCSLDLVIFLVERGVDIYVEDSNGDTAAIVAKKKRRTDVFKYLQKELSLKNRLFH